MNISLDCPPIKGFDAIKESRRCKRIVGRRLDAMTIEERVTYLRKSVKELYAKSRRERGRKQAALVGH